MLIFLQGQGSGQLGVGKIARLVLYLLGLKPLRVGSRDAKVQGDHRQLKPRQSPPLTDLRAVQDGPRHFDPSSSRPDRHRP